MKATTTAKVLAAITALIGKAEAEACFSKSGTFGKNEGTVLDDITVLESARFTDHRVSAIKVCKENERAVGI